MRVWEAIRHFRELHEQFKSGALGVAEVEAYEAERDAFVCALVQVQQLTLQPGQSLRQVLRVAAVERVSLQFGERREGTVTRDIGYAGFAAVIGPIASRIACEFELGIAPEPVRGRARVVACERQKSGDYCSSFAIESVSDKDRTRLEIGVIDAALQMLSRQGT